jgi:lipopolysaccharide/colanic/teichoic acid biosynthesis glycosyltransferase
MRDRQEGAVPTGYAVVKRSLDIAVSLVMTILTLPVLLAAALAVRLNSPGPAFFRQQRVGKDGVEFWMVKLRTMVIDHGEEVFHSHLDRLAEAGDVDDMYTIRIDDDPRVTTVGAKLRKWSLDELPNLWNVLKGNMSLVGPRPLVVAEAELIGYDNPRFTVRPGVTGLAQVRGRDSISLEERTGYDEIYVAERSMKGDLKILLATFGTVFRQPGKEED